MVGKNKRHRPEDWGGAFWYSKLNNNLMRTHASDCPRLYSFDLDCICGGEYVQVKAMKNGLGQWGVWWGLNKATKLAYKRFFKTEETAIDWANKFRLKITSKI